MNDATRCTGSTLRVPAPGPTTCVTHQAPRNADRCTGSTTRPHPRLRPEGRVVKGRNGLTCRQELRPYRPGRPVGQGSEAAGQRAGIGRDSSAATERRRIDKGPALSPRRFLGRHFRPRGTHPSDRKAIDTKKYPPTHGDRHGMPSSFMDGYGISSCRITFQPAASAFRPAGFPFSLRDTPHLADPAGVGDGLTLP